jgi:hypothetical protein
VPVKECIASAGDTQGAGWSPLAADAEQCGEPLPSVSETESVSRAIVDETAARENIATKQCLKGHPSSASSMTVTSRRRRFLRWRPEGCMSVRLADSNWLMDRPPIAGRLAGVKPSSGSCNCRESSASIQLISAPVSTRAIACRGEGICRPSACCLASSCALQPTLISRSAPLSLRSFETTGMAL